MLGPVTVPAMGVAVAALMLWQRSGLRFTWLKALDEFARRRKADDAIVQFELALARRSPRDLYGGQFVVRNIEELEAASEALKQAQDAYRDVWLDKHLIPACRAVVRARCVSRAAALGDGQVSAERIRTLGRKPKLRTRNA